MVDLATRKPKNRTFEIKDPATDENLGIRVTVMSVDDTSLNLFKRQVNDRNNAAERKGKPISQAEAEANGLSLLFRATVGWEWYGEGVTYNGAKPEFNEQNFKDICIELKWFKDQVDTEVGDKKAFFDN